jgi:hypothetical protein
MSQNIHRLRFYQEELFNAKKNLIYAGSVRNLKAIEQRIGFLNERIKEFK